MNGFIDNTEYSFRIFDRWGECIWQTDNYNIGWNGNDSGGKESKQGIYFYLIKFKTAIGKYVEKKGCVTLLR